MKRSKRFRFHLLAIALLLLALPALAAAPVADVSLGTVQVEWQPTGDFAGMKLRVSSPLGVTERAFPAGENPLFDLRSFDGVADGLYTWEIVATPRLDEGTRRAMAAARASGDESGLRNALPNGADFVQSGSFRVVDGAILQPTGAPEAGSASLRRASGNLERAAAADQVIPDDLIVQQSLCVGFDCVNGESFGFDTIRLKENNTRIKFEDTSTGTFPSNDWQLTANDSASGGQNKFSIEDITGARVPFTIEAGSTTNSIYVDSTGRVGFRTSTPVLDLHIATSNTPGIRLEQNNSGGFTAQTWDVAGNEANFFVRDVTGGSRLSFRIRPGAPTSSLDISADGDVGVGTGAPEAHLHVLNTGENVQNVLTLEASGTGGRPRLTFSNPDGDWFYEVNGTNFDINRSGTGSPEELRLSSTGNLTIAGSLTELSSRTAKQGFAELDPADVLAKVVELPVLEWSYTADDEGTRHIGPLAEDFYQAFGLGADDRHIAPSDKVGVALLAIQGLQQELAQQKVELEERLRQLEQLIDELKVE